MKTIYFSAALALLLLTSLAARADSGTPASSPPAQSRGGQRVSVPAPASAEGSTFRTGGDSRTASGGPARKGVVDPQSLNKGAVAGNVPAH